MDIIAIKTKKFLPPQENILPELFSRVRRMPERSIIAVTSKIVSINQGRCIPISEITDKDELIRAESDYYLPRGEVPGAFAMHTLKDNVLIPSAGVDTSNAGGYYILWPKRLSATAKNWWSMVRDHYNIKQCGILITDSHSVPLRRGVVGISLAHYGFAPLTDYRGRKDIFGEKLVMSQANVADALAAAAAVVMGEGREQTPCAFITDIPFVRFTARPQKLKRRYSKFSVPLKQDIYYPFLKRVPWRKGGTNKNQISKIKMQNDKAK